MRTKNPRQISIIFTWYSAIVLRRAQEKSFRSNGFPVLQVVISGEGGNLKNTSNDAMN